MKGASRKFLVPVARVRALRMGCGEPLAQHGLLWRVPRRSASCRKKVRRECGR